MSIAILIIALALIIARKAIARAVKKYIASKRKQARLYFKALARRAWLASKVTVARRTIGGLA